MREPEANTSIEYRPIEGFPGYRVGNDGSIWSCRKVRHLGGDNGSISYLSDEWKKLKCSPDFTGYSRATLTKELKRYYKKVHILVAEAFHGPRPPGMVACHRDGNSLNAAASNIYWGTPKQNEEDKRRHGKLPMGEKHCCAKLTDRDIVKIRRRSARGETFQSIADSYGMAIASIWMIVHRVNWKHIA